MLTAGYIAKVRRLIDQTSGPNPLLHLSPQHKLSTLKSEFTHLMAKDDYSFRLSQSNSRLGISPVNSKDASDPVYRKISSIEKFLSPTNGKPWTYAGAIRDNINEIQLRIEKRQMGSAEYTELLAKPTLEILEEWVDEAEKMFDMLRMMS